MKFLENGQLKRLGTEDALQEAVDFYEKNDVWAEPYADEIRAFGVTKAPLVNGEVKESISETCPEESFEECVNDSGIFLSLPYENRYRTYASRYTSLNSIYERSGTNCRMVRTLDSHGYITALSAEARGEIIARGWLTSREKVKVLITDEMVGFVGSNKYVILPYKEGIQAAKDVVGEKFDMGYHGGEICHEYICADWEITSPETEAHRMFLEDIGICGNVKYFFRFSSSNIGYAKMSGRLMVQVDGVKIPIGRPVSVWHHAGKDVKNVSLLTPENGCSIQHYRYKLASIGASLAENEELIEAMGNTQIDDAVKCVTEMLEFCPSIPKKLKTELIENSVKLIGGTAVDAYLEISALAEKVQGKAKIEAFEEVSQLQYKDWGKYSF